MTSKAVNVGTPGHIDHGAPSGVSELKGVVRCELTGNPCGTDTWCLGKPPSCRCGKIERLQDGYRRILDASDLEMGDGDLARTIAKEMLAPNAAHEPPATKTNEGE